MADGQIAVRFRGKPRYHALDDAVGQVATNAVTNEIAKVFQRGVPIPTGPPGFEGSAPMAICLLSLEFAAVL